MVVVGILMRAAERDDPEKDVPDKDVDDPIAGDGESRPEPLPATH